MPPKIAIWRIGGEQRSARTYLAALRAWSPCCGTRPLVRNRQTNRQSNRFSAVIR
jgi:hypothetical protein